MDMAQWLMANPGSTSRKYSLYRDGRQLAFINFREKEDQIEYTLYSGDSQVTESLNSGSLNSAVAELPAIFHQQTGIEVNPGAIALRIVASGHPFQQHQWLDEDKTYALKAEQKTVPIHVSIAINEYQKLTETFKEVPVLGVSDNAFHATQSDAISRYGLDPDLEEKYAAKRFGYHGLATASVARFIKENFSEKGLRAVHAHLGGGTSINAIKDGQSVYASMGLSPIEGPMMMGRSGNIDPALVAQLSESFDSPKRLVTHLSRNCGIKSRTGTSDMKELERLYKKGDEQVVQAIDKYISDVCGYIGTSLMHLRGIDLLVFSGGMAENSAIVISKILERLQFLGLEVHSSNPNPSSSCQTLTSPDSAVKALLFKISEEDEMAAILEKELHERP